jgi:hypothetical protein
MRCGRKAGFFMLRQSAEQDLGLSNGSDRARTVRFRPYTPGRRTSWRPANVVLRATPRGRRPAPLASLRSEQVWTNPYFFSSLHMSFSAARWSRTIGEPPPQIQRSRISIFLAVTSRVSTTGRSLMNRGFDDFGSTGSRSSRRINGS